MTSQIFWNWFYNSASVLWSRFQVLFGCIMLVLTTTDMSPWLPETWMPIWLIISNVIAEYLRRSNTRTDTIQVVDQQLGIMSDVTYLKSKTPIPEGADLVKLKSSTPSTRVFDVWYIIGLSFTLSAVVFMTLFYVLR